MNMPIINSLVNWINTKRLAQIKFFKNNPIEVQQKCLKELLYVSKDTQWGRTYDYKSIRSLSDFSSRVPIQTYEDLKPYVERMRKGESNILWPSEVKWFAKSSGTTNDKSKFIPVSKEALENCHYRAGKDIMAIYTNLYPDTSIFSGKGLTLGGSHEINNTKNHSFYGDLSAILIQNLPFWTDFIRTPDTSVALLSEWEEKLAKMVSITVNENVTSLSGVPSWYLVLLNSVLEYTGKSNISEVWPNLELFVHGGVSFVPYKEQYKKIISSPNMHYLETYNASEGFFGIQDDPEDDSMLLMLDYGIYYEFIPTSELENDNAKVLSLEEVELGVNYAIIISTNGGLWRYEIGDTVYFTSLLPFKFKISGRTKLFINAFGEEIIIDNAENALNKACLKTNSSIKEYTAGPIYMKGNKKGAHQWLIEFEKAPADLNLFTYYLDTELMNLNSDYEAKRYKNTTLTRPIIVLAEKNLFYTWLKNKGKLGGQNKVPRLSNTRDIIDQLLAINHPSRT